MWFTAGKCVPFSVPGSQRFSVMLVWFVFDDRFPLMVHVQNMLLPFFGMVPGT